MLDYLVSSLRHRREVIYAMQEAQAVETEFQKQVDEVSKFVNSHNALLSEAELEFDYKRVGDQYLYLWAVRLIEAAKKRRMILETRHLQRAADALLLNMPDEGDQTLWESVDELLVVDLDKLHDAIDRPYRVLQQFDALTIKGIAVARAAIRKERKERIDIFQVHVALSLSSIAALFSFASFLVAVFKGCC